MRTAVLLILVTLFSEGKSGPIIDSSEKDLRSCARVCTGTSKFNYVPGTTYEFEYYVHTSTAMEGASAEREALGIMATANIEVLSKCDLALRLQDVSIHQFKPVMFSSLIYPDVRGEFKRNLERYPLRFFFQDGVVEELCPSDGESTWALNIKRGFLTAFQNSMTNLDRDETVREKDIAGECNTNYKVAYRGWFSKTIKKTKNLSGCTDRNGYRSSVHAVPYRVPSEIQSLPLMKSTHECEQELDRNGRLKTALIRETHTFRPFSQATSGATTRIEQRLSYKSQSSGVAVRQEVVQRRTGLAFEHQNGHESRNVVKEDVENKLREICLSTLEDIRPHTPKLFAELVYHVKNMDVEDLRRVYRKVKEGTVCTKNIARIKKFFLDSLPMTGTSASVQIMKEILLNREVTGPQATMWITSFSFIHYPFREMLHEVKGLLYSPQYSESSMLPISTMINNYCNHHDSCSEDASVTNIISALENVIGNRCFVRDSNLESTLLALRALGNAGHLNRLTTTLSRCFVRQSNPAEVRVAAIQAFRRLYCTADRGEVLNIYRDSSEDSEVRIAAYLAVMKCPDDDLLRIIQETLEHEKSSQVGSFVWTHLLNLLESSSPHKQSIKRIIKDKRLYRPFDMEILKYSQNYEGSVFWDNVNMGSTLESDVIFADKSLILRSLSLNLTVDLFGNSINLLELGSRIEGLEYMMQTYLDESSYFRAWTKDKYKPNMNLNSLKGDIYIRMFGNELYYNHFMGTDSLASAKKFNFLEMLINMANNKDFSFTQSVMILDSSMVIPTCSGMPLNLTINGTATIDLQASGQVDLRKLTTSPSSMLIDGMIKPSGALQIAGTMVTDAFVTKVGLKVLNTWHSSTSVKGQMEVKRGKILSAELDFPQKEITVLDVRTEFFRIHGELEKKGDLSTDKKKTLELCTGSRLATITGLELCNEFKWTNASMKADAPYFPFTGPFSQSLILYKRDTHTSYKLMAKRSVEKDMSTAQIVLDTPGSRTDRSIDISFVLNKKPDDKDIKIRLNSPWKKAKLEGSLFHNKKKIGVSGTVSVDITYDFTAQVGIRKTRNAMTMTPRLEVRRPGVKDILLSGKVSSEGLKDANVYLVLTGVKTEKMTFRADMVNINNKNMYKGSFKGAFSLNPGEDYSAEASIFYRDMDRRGLHITVIPTLTINTPKQDVISVVGSGIYKKNKSLKSKLSFDVPILTDEPLSLECDLLQVSGRRSKYLGHFKINSEVLKSKLSGNVHMKKGTTSSSFSLNYNLPRMINTIPDKILLKSKVINRSSRSQLHYKINLHFSDKHRPHLHLVNEITFSHQAKQTELEVSLKYGQTSRGQPQHVSAYSLVHHLVLKTSTDITYNIRLDLEPVDHFSHLEGKYKYTRSSITSTTTLNYGSNVDQNGNMKNVSAAVYINKQGNTRRRSFSTTVNIQTPFQGYQKLSARFECNRDMEKVRSFGSLLWDNEKEMTLEVDLGPHLALHENMELNVKATSPFDHFRSITGAFKHKLSWKSLVVNAKFALESSIETAMGINFTHKTPGHSILDIQTDLRTRLSGFGRITFRSTQVLSQSQVQSQTQIYYGNGKIISSDVTFTVSSPSLRINVVVETPFNTFRTSEILITYHGPFKNSRSHLHIGIMGYSFICDANMKFGGPFSVGLAATSNIKSLERISAVIKYGKTSSSLALTASASLQNATIGASILGSRVKSATNASIIVWTPFKNFRETGFEVHCSSSWYKDNSASVKLFDGKNINWKMEHSSVQPHGFREIIELKTPFNGFEIYSVEIETSFCPTLYLNITLKYGTDRTITFDTVVEKIKENNVTKCQTTFVATTPFHNYEFSKAVFGVRGKPKNFTGIIDISFSDIKIAVQTVFLDKRRKTGKLYIATNIKNYENIHGTFNISSRWKHLNATTSLTVNGETMETELTSDLWYHILGFKLRTPFTENFVFSFNRSVVDGNTKARWEFFVMCMDGKVITLNITWLYYGMQIDMETPFEGYEKQGLHIIFPRIGKCCKGHVGLKVIRSDGKEVEISLGYNVSRHYNVPRHFDVTLTAQAEDARGQIHIMCVMVNDIPVNAEFKTKLRLPNEGHKEQMIHYRHEFGNGNLEGILELVQIEETDLFITVKGMKKPNDIDGEISVTWDKDHNGNIRILTSLTDQIRYYRIDKRLNIRLVHPSQSLALVGNILQTPKEARSHGEFIWNEDEGKKIFYDVGVKDSSRRYSKMYDGTMKVGSPSRSLQMYGSYSDTGVTRTMDGTFYWDADRDNTKQVGVKAVVTPGDRNKKADLSFRISSIGKDIILTNELFMDDGRVIFSGKTKLSYSRDHKKTLILNARLEDISSGYRNTNYSLKFGIKHPHTDVDVTLASHLGSSREKYTSSMDVFYLTDWREKKNFVLRGNIFKATNRVELQVTSPMNTMELCGEIHERPYKVLIKSRNNFQVMKADVTVDTRRGQIDLQTSYDIDDPRKNLLMSARYVNSSNVQASVYRQIYSNIIQDSLINFRLNASRLIHTRLTWRPEIIAEIQGFLRTQVDQYGRVTQRAFRTVYESVGQELSGKYSRITQAVSEEITPFLNLLESEMAAIERQLDSIRRDIKRMYSQNEVVVRQVGEYLDLASIFYKRTLKSFMATLVSGMKSMRKQLDTMAHFPMRERYDAVLSNFVELMKRTVDTAGTEVKEVISKLDDQFLTVWWAARQHYAHVHNVAQDSIDRVVNLPRFIDNNLQISNTVSPYLNSLYTNTIQSYGNVKDMFQSSGEGITSYLVDANQREDLNQLYTLTNEIFKEGVSAYNQWKDNDRLNRPQVLDVLEENAVDYLNEEIFYYKPEITVWDPDHGEVQVELYLPIPLKSLDTLPDVQPFVQPYVQGLRTAVNKYQKARTAVSKYLSDNRTIK